jgi:hypothetical protein
MKKRMKFDEGLSKSAFIKLNLHFSIHNSRAAFIPPRSQSVNSKKISLPLVSMEGYELSSSFKSVNNAEKVPTKLPLCKTNFNFQELLFSLSYQTAGIE